MNEKPISMARHASNVVAVFGLALLASKVWSVSDYRDHNGVGLDLAIASFVLWMECLLYFLDEVKALLIAAADRHRRERHI